MSFYYSYGNSLGKNLIKSYGLPFQLKVSMIETQIAKEILDDFFHRYVNHHQLKHYNLLQARQGCFVFSPRLSSDLPKFELDQNFIRVRQKFC